MNKLGSNSGGQRTSRLGRRHAAVAGLAVLGAVSVAACSSGGGSSTPSSNGHVTITVGCEPPKTQAAQRNFFLQDIKLFEKANPNVTVQGDDTNPCDDPTTFDAKLASGKMDNVFYTYFTDAANVVSSGQAADITKYAGQVKSLSNIQPDLVNLYRKGGSSSGDLYGVPVSNYTLGLLYNKQLFQRAGLNPNQPPTTWAEVRTDAKKISALGGGIVGYGDYSAANVGGWHFTAEMYSLGGSMVSGQKASFDNATGMQVLQNLQAMRWTDNSMGSKQLLQYNDLPQMMGSGKLGMYVAAPDNVTYIHQEYGSSYANMAEGPMPGNGGTLLGGDGYMFNKKDTPAQIQAGIKFLNFEFLTPGAGQFNFKRAKAAAQPVGLPEPNIWTAGTAVAKSTNSDEDSNATIPVSNFTPYLNAAPNMKNEIEPPQAQAIYAQGDKVMAAVLTQRNANLKQLLGTFSTQVNSILANQQ
ncbi:MAG TPA: extracellular solute-binding protein [Streptosporangiaceae bacterium]|jgi:multiple sugar transport system substrate-binding protein|nr:extracellular solute-binding protein [Streptosporangiaceae bacterium]